MTAANGPLVVLHDHLDGGVRPTTVLELARSAGVTVPIDDADALATWMTITPGMAFEEAFSRFDLVIAATQTSDALRRISREAVEDLAADGVVHAELRFAPLNHVAGGLTPDEVMAAVHAGLEDAAASGCDARLIVCAMRHLPEAVSVEAAELAVRWMAERVVGLDLAGGEVGHPAADHVAAYRVAEAAGLGRTVHAGEMDGVAQVRSALDHCAPDRIGHGWRLIDDCEVADGRITSLGPTAAEVRDGGIPLEICLTSNACLGTPVAEHPVRLLFDAGFRVTFHPDDRSITTTTARRELALAAEHHAFSDVELAACIERAAGAAFLSDDERDALVDRVADGWNARPARLVHLAEATRWEATRERGSYLPAEWDRDGFIHLSSLHQLLTPANRFYRGRDDLVALVLDAHLLGSAVVWEAGTGTVERFPHLYAAITPDAVLAEVPMRAEPDGGFLLPPALVRAVRSPLGR
ncbi:MAG: adenosine deaminase [Actinomycetota bacterium]